MRFGFLTPLLATVLATSAADGSDETGGTDGSHWALRPLARPAIPDLGAGTPIDSFVSGSLESHGLQLAERAADATLARRIAFDLTGLPIRAEDIVAVAAERSPARIDRLIDRLLASPGFGEKWGRHWLDVARYADSKGYVFEEERRYPYAYTYRDWVVRAWNEDLPYDAFLRYQLAADALVDGSRKDPDERRHLAALGYLTLGRRFLNREPDIIDDRIDVVSRGMLGLTVSCARCHDHKFDPIPTEDYYSLYGVFASSEEPSDKPLLSDPDPDDDDYRTFRAELETRERKVADFKRERRDALFAEENLEAYLRACWDWHAGRAGAASDIRRFAQDRKLYPAALERWRALLFDKLGPEHPVFGLWRQVAALPADATPDDVAAALQNPPPGALPSVADFLRANPMDSTDDVHRRYATLLHEGDVSGETGGESGGESRALHDALRHPDGIASLSPDALVRDYQVSDRNAVRKLERDVDQFQAVGAGSPPRGMVLTDRAAPVEPVVFLRGNARSPGERVPRRFLRMLSPPGERRPFVEGSGRKELAAAITSPENPLTARVIANRVWLQLLGSPLVESPSDFGVRTPPPAIPGLLDYLASYLIENHWSLKSLIRHILQSGVYQQTSEASEAALAADPENRLFSRAQRRRIGFESLRDSMLLVSGLLDARIGGRAVDLEAEPFSRRRTLYGFIDRQNLPGIYRTFDFASPDAHCPERHETTVPQQALFLLNNAFAQQMADALVGSLEPAPVAGLASRKSVEERIARLYRQTLSRNPAPEELEVALAFLGESADREQWAALAQALLSSNEFVFID